MTTAHGSFQGFAPIVKVVPGNPEAQKYGKLWEHAEYRAFSPGEYFAHRFLLQAHPARGATVIDFGCGTGRAGYKLATQAHLKVTLIDFVRNSLDAEVRQLIDDLEQFPDPEMSLQFVKADLEKPLPVKAEYGYCADVMEHIPPDRVDAVLNNILLAAQHVFFSIALAEDHCGGLIGETLHLSVHPFEWWEQKFKERDCLIKWSRLESQGVAPYAQFYVTSWQDAHDVVNCAVLNSEEEKIRANVRYNVGQCWMMGGPQEENDSELMILGGGPSLDQYLDEIKKNIADGVKVITLNGAYNWAINHGIDPGAQIIVDARPFNSRFVEPLHPTCRYLIASQADPSVFENLPADRTFIWHTSAELIEDILKDAYPAGYFVIPGGSTVLLRAIPLLRQFGYRKFILYGCDSCLTEDNKHHAYAQAENDQSMILPVIVNPGGRIFRCHTWMVSQAQEFIGMIQQLGDVIELDVKGDGLLAHILKTGADAAELAEL